MNAQEYSELAIRTECNQSLSRAKIGRTEEAIRLNHSAIGISGEAGEIASAIEKWVYYGQNLDRVNLLEEYGDLLWYINLGCNALGITLEQVMESNISKLSTRFPNSYKDYYAAEENRNREKEREALEEGYKDAVEPMEQTGVGWAEPPEDELENKSSSELSNRTYNQLNELTIRLSEAEIVRDHWKSNHDMQVKRNAVLRERPDLPVERLEVYKEFEHDRMKLTDIKVKVEQLNSIDWSECDPNGVCTSIVAEIRRILDSNRPGYQP